MIFMSQTVITLYNRQPQYTDTNKDKNDHTTNNDLFSFCGLKQRKQSN